MTEGDQRSFLLMDERENLQVNLNLLVQLLVIYVNNVTSYGFVDSNIREITFR